MTQHPPSRPGPDEALAALRGARPSDDVSRRVVERVFARRAPRRPWLPAALVAGALAAAALAVFALRAPSVPGDTVAIGPHTVVRDADADVEVVRRRADDTLVRLGAGAATFVVDPLAAGESFRVRTPELEVEVVGTAFRVHTAEGCSTVEVREGRVRVSAGAASSLLGAGESTRHCAALTEAAVPGEALVREAQRLMLDPASAARAAELFETYARRHPDGVFIEEALFHLPFARRASGEAAEAEAAAARFLERFPQSRRAARVRDAFAAP